MTIPFIKMHGLGNDYVYIDCFLANTAKKLATVDLPSMARQVSDRHTGIGSDGLVLILPSEVANLRMRMFNADGSEAEMCGNAARCIARYAYEHRLGGQTMTLETKAGIKHLLIDTRSGLITVEMGTAMGNPHRVFFVDTPKALDTQFAHLCTDDEWRELRATTNIECAYVQNRKEIRMRVCERGTGETRACGTGACATVMEAINRGLADNTVKVHMPGGEVLVHRDENGIIYLTGTATEVFTGEYKYEEKPCK